MINFCIGIIWLIFYFMVTPSFPLFLHASFFTCSLSDFLSLFCLFCSFSTFYNFKPNFYTNCVLDIFLIYLSTSPALALFITLFLFSTLSWFDSCLVNKECLHSRASIARFRQRTEGKLWLTKREANDRIEEVTKKFQKIKLELKKVLLFYPSM